MKDSLFTIVFLVLCLTFLVGCDGDGDGGQATQTTQDTSTDTDAAQNGDEVPKPEIVLDSGGMTVSGAGERFVCKVYPPSAGRLRATLIWDAPPDEFSLYFFCYDTLTEYPLETGGSPLIVEEHVSEPWQSWTLYLVSDGIANVSYVVMFQPD